MRVGGALQGCWHVGFTLQRTFTLHTLFVTCCVCVHVNCVCVQEELYEEDMSAKVRATGMIAQLCRHTENFDVLLMHGTLLQVCFVSLESVCVRMHLACMSVIAQLCAPPYKELCATALRYLEVLLIQGIVLYVY